MKDSGDYISRDAALDAVSEWLMKALHPENMSSYNEGERAAYRTAISEIAELPAADVRPLVLCKDCLHYEMGACLKIYDDGAANKDAWQERKPDDFCSYGEKREES